MYQGIYLDLCEMWPYAVVHKCELVIDLDSEVAVAVTLYSLSQTEWLYPMHSVRVAALRDGSASHHSLAPWLHKGIIFAFYRGDDPSKVKRQRSGRWI